MAILNDSDIGNTLIGTKFSDTINGNGGADILFGGNGDDLINGGDGNDTLSGDNGNDTLNGDLGADQISGGNGNDLISGGDGDDKLLGDNGDDTLIGGLGADTLTGGSGADVFRYLSASDSLAPDLDWITDFKQGADKIDLTGLDLVWSGVPTLNGVWYEKVSGIDYVKANINGADFQIRVSGLGGASINADDFIGLGSGGGNDAPVVTSASLTVNEGGTVALTAADFGITDPDSSSFTYTVSGVANGQFELTSAPGTAVTSFTSADLAGNLVQFVHDGSESAPAFSVTVNDGTADSNTLAATITFNNVNDAPTITSGPTFSATQITINANDADAGDDIGLWVGATQIGGVLSKGSSTSVTLAAQPSVLSGNLMLKDALGGHSVDTGYNLYLGTTGADTTLDASGSSKAAAIYGFGNNDNPITGSSFDDYIFGGDGNDTILGGNGNDTISGGIGSDTISGDGGNDLFVIAGSAEGDIISDFNNGNDTLDISSKLSSITYGEFNDASANFTNANVFVIGGNTSIDTAAANIANDADVTGSNGIIVVNNGVNTFVYGTDNLAGNGTEVLLVTLVGVYNGGNLAAADFTT